MTLQEMKIEQKEALEAANNIVSSCELVNRGMSAAEKEKYETHMEKYRSLGATIKARGEQSTIRTMFGKDNNPLWLSDTPEDAGSTPTPGQTRLRDARSPEYRATLDHYFASGGKILGPELRLASDGHGGFLIPGSEQFTLQRLPNGSVSAALYGGSSTAGGYAVSVPTDPRIVPLAVPDLGIFDAATVIETATDTKIPQQASFGTAEIKAESTGTVATFGGDDPTLGQVTLSAFMAGALRVVSWELIQDVPTFQEFIISDLLAAQRILEGVLERERVEPDFALSDQRLLVIMDEFDRILDRDDV